MKKLVHLSVFLAIFLNLLQGNTCLAQPGYQGTYQLHTGQVLLTLEIQQDGFGALTGALGSSTGERFALQGMVTEGVAAGIFTGNEGSLYFEAYLDGDELTLSLIQPDAFNMPDYENAQYLVMNRSGGPANQDPGQTPVRQQVQPYTSQPQAVPPRASSGQGEAPAPVPAGTERISDEMNGYSFIKPDGWVHQLVDGQYLLGSNTIPGLISVFPHQARNMQEMMGMMQEGLQEEGVSLSLEGNPRQKGSNMLTGMCAGYVQGEQARGYVIGVLGSQGGGVFVLAVSTPQKLGQEIMTAADFLAGNTQFSRPKTGDSDLVRHFSGQWMWTNGYRTEWLSFYPDGSFSNQYEASYSGNLSDGAGNVTGNWGVANQERNLGRWSIQGNMDAGMITVINPDGSRTTYEYRVHVEKGQTYYREYKMNGYHFAKQKNF